MVARRRAGADERGRAGRVVRSNGAWVCVVDELLCRPLSVLGTRSTDRRLERDGAAARRPARAGRPRRRSASAGSRAGARSRESARSRTATSRSPRRRSADRNVVRGAASDHLVDEPEALLCERALANARARNERRQLAARAPAVRARARARAPRPSAPGGTTQSGRSTSNCLHTRPTRRAASSEWPPRAKKLSFLPTRSTSEQLAPELRRSTARTRVSRLDELVRRAPTARERAARCGRACRSAAAAARSSDRHRAGTM